MAETDDALMEKFFEGEPFTQEELTEGVRVGVTKRAPSRRYSAAAPLRWRVRTWCCATSKSCCPAQRAALGALRADRDGNEVEIACEAKDPLCAYVFKTVADPFVGKMSYVKVVSGTLKADSPVVNGPRTGEPERVLGKLVFVKGKKQIGTRRRSARATSGPSPSWPAAQDGRHAVRAGPCGRACRAPEFPVADATPRRMKVKQKGDEGKICGASQRLDGGGPDAGVRR